MREIKFRAWLPKIKEMTEVYVIDQTRYSGIEYHEDCRSWNKDNQQYRFKYDSAEFMQFTGVKDEDGVEIYEGDIVYVGEEKPCKECGVTKVRNCYQVVWYKDYDGWYLGENGQGGAIYVNKPIKIIGNIYENPELLSIKER